MDRLPVTDGAPMRRFDRARSLVKERLTRTPRESSAIRQERGGGINGEEDRRRSSKAAEVVRQEIVAATPQQTELSERQKILIGDFHDGQLVGNKLVVPEDTAQKVRGKANDFVKSRPALAIKPWYFLAGNRTATGYDSPFARNRSTQTKIETLPSGERVFLIDPRGSAVHRFLDTRARRAFGHPARKVSVKEWKPLMHQKSEIPVLQSEGSDGAKFPYKDVVAVPYISNVNGVDYFANNHRMEMDFPEEFSWAKEAQLEDKLQVGEEAMRVANDIHSRGKAWGEMATHNSLIVKQPDGKITVIPADTEVEYDDTLSPTEKYARDIFDLTVTIAGGLHKSEGVEGEGYDAVVSRLFGAYQNKEVIEQVGPLVQPPLKGWKRILYDQYEFKRFNELPYEQYLQITQAMQRAAKPTPDDAPALAA